MSKKQTQAQEPAVEPQPVSQEPQNIIRPTPGRIVWIFGWRPASGEPGDDSQPLAAIVTYVHNDRLINVAAFEPNGHHRPLKNVRLWQPGEADSDGGAHAEWMPYQIGQAAKQASAPPTS